MQRNVATPTAEHRANPASPAAPVSRRRFFALAAWGAAAALFPGVAGATRPPSRATRRLSFHNLHTDERFDACYWEHGTYVPSVLERIDAVLRDHRTGEIRRMDPRLIDLVFALTVRLGNSAPVQVVSGYRSAATNELLRAADPGRIAGRSLHLSGEAVDLCFTDRSLRAVRDAALSLHGGGVGYYPRTGFVHLDVGAVRRW